jgi:hypothetical protein
MLPFGMTISATVWQRSEIPEGLMNYPVLGTKNITAFSKMIMQSVPGKNLLSDREN